MGSMDPVNIPYGLGVGGPPVPNIMAGQPTLTPPNVHPPSRNKGLIFGLSKGG